MECKIVVPKESRSVCFEFEKEHMDRQVEDERKKTVLRAMERKSRRKEMQSYRKTMEKMLIDNSKNIQAILDLIRSL